MNCPYVESQPIGHSVAPVNGSQQRLPRLLFVKCPDTLTQGTLMVSLYLDRPVSTA